MVRENPGFYIRITVGDCRSLGLTVRYEPEQDNPTHCVLILSEEKQSKPAIAGIRNEFLKKAALFRVENGTVVEIGPATGDVSGSRS